MKDDIWEQTLDAIAKRAPASEIHEGDYTGEDGLLHCGVCHKPKQRILDFMGRPKIFPKQCDCQLEATRKKEEEARATELLKRAARLRRDCFHTEEAASWNFKADDLHNERISAAFRRYVDKWEDAKADSMGLLLYGPVGTGKSFFAACIANALIDQGVPALMTSFSRIVNTMQGSFGGRQEYLDRLVSYPLLILDDLGAERGSDYMLEQVYAVVDARYQTGLPLIVTTNIPISEIKEPADLKYKRIYDRILERCHPVEITGESRRRRALKDNFGKRRDLLGL